MVQAKNQYYTHDNFCMLCVMTIQYIMHNVQDYIDFFSITILFDGLYARVGMWRNTCTTALFHYEGRFGSIKL
jgi:hypothetical protein